MPKCCACGQEIPLLKGWSIPLRDLDTDRESIVYAEDGEIGAYVGQESGKTEAEIVAELSSRVKSYIANRSEDNKSAVDYFAIELAAKRVTEESLKRDDGSVGLRRDRYVFSSGSRAKKTIPTLIYATQKLVIEELERQSQ